MDNETGLNSVAIIGIAGRFPGAENVQRFWENLCKGVESISAFSAEELEFAGISKKLVDAPNYVKARGILEGVEFFDAEFFGFSAREAQITDPQHRLFLECSWDALENAGYCSYTYPGSIGVYGGAGTNSYFLNNIYPNHDLREALGEYLLHIGNEKDFMTTRVSYKLNLKGPSFTIQTACSTSLVAICVACNHLLSYQCDMALAGGVSIAVPQIRGYQYQEGMIFSPDGCCKPFDAAALGTVPGNGAGIVVLKRLQDAIADRDHIYAVIKGYGINNDGMEKVGYSAPSVAGQTEAISSAIAMAEINPETINYTEAHGTGTLLGDPIEIKALTQAFQTFTQKKGYCAIGSVKSNVGHLIEAAGVTGLIKTALSLHHQQLPPTLQFSVPNPHIDFSNSPFYVNTALKKWDSGLVLRRACVSSFGVGGTNAHVILEEKPLQASSIPSRRHQLLLLSAKTPTALKAMSIRLGKHLQEHPFLPLADVAYTLQMGRKAFEERLMLISSNVEEASSLLSDTCQHSEKKICAKINPLDEPTIVFIFADHGSQYINMGRGLYQTEPCYRREIDLCSALLKDDLGVDLRHILYPSPEQLAIAEQQFNQSVIAQCALFMTEYALGKLWQEWGIRPQSMICHGLSEYVAACLAGVFTIEEALKLVMMRGRLMQNTENSSASATSFSEASTRRQMNEALMTEFNSFFKQIKLMPPKIPLISNLTGSWIPSEEITSPDHWVQQLENSMTISTDILEVMKEPNRFFIIVGPDRIPGCIADQHLSSDSKSFVVSSLPSMDQLQEDSQVMLNTLGQLWLAGAKIDWDGFNKFEQRFRVPLPTYPFEKKRFWIDPPLETLAPSQSNTPIREMMKISSIKEIEASLLIIWKDLLGSESIGINDDFFKLGGDSLLAIQTTCRIQENFNLPLQFQILIECPTITRLARVISEKLATHKSRDKEIELSSVLVRLKEGRRNKPLFLIHPIGGHVFCYKPLTECMEYEGPIYGIQAPQFASKEIPPLNSLEEIASYYLRAIRTIQPDGPYYFLGASFGGLVAYEMARQLKDSGQRVNLLALLDIIRPDATPYQINNDVDMLGLLVELFEGKSLSINDLEELSQEDQAKRLMKSMGVEMLSFSEQLKIFEQVKIHWRALMNYCPKPYQGKITFFQAADRFTRTKNISLGSTWQNLATEGVDLHEIPGSHLSMIMQPHVAKLAHLLDSYLER